MDIEAQGGERKGGGKDPRVEQQPPASPKPRREENEREHRRRRGCNGRGGRPGRPGTPGAAQGLDETPVQTVAVQRDVEAQEAHREEDGDRSAPGRGERRAAAHPLGDSGENRSQHDPGDPRTVRQAAGREKRRGRAEQGVNGKRPAPAGERPQERGEPEKKRDERILPAQASRMDEKARRRQEKRDRPERRGGLRSGPRMAHGPLEIIRGAGEAEPEDQSGCAESLIPVRSEGGECPERRADGHRDEEEDDDLPDQPRAHPLVRVTRHDLPEKLFVDGADPSPFAGGLPDGFEPLGGGQLSAHGSPSCECGRRRRARGRAGWRSRRGRTRPPCRGRPRRSTGGAPGAPR